MITKVLFENKKMGVFPYKNYNYSIIKLNSEETLRFTNQQCDKESALVIFFVASPNNRYGTMSFIGLINYEMLIIFLKNESAIQYNNFWIIKPHLLQNDKGPKCADCRIFKLKNNIGIIGYSRVAPRSNTPNIPDYYVRVSLLDTCINNNLYINPHTLYNFNSIDGGCFPSKIGNNYKKFTLEDDAYNINNIEFFIKDNKNSKPITPHKSKHRLMPSKMTLNGIEVSFSKTSSNEDSKTHISTKNIIPIQHIDCLDNICGFVDLTPPNCNNPKLTIQNVNSGNVLFTDNLYINDKFKSKFYRGTIPFIELDCNLWITMGHERNQTSKLMYKYYYQIYDNKQIVVDNKIVNIPNKCIQELLFDENKIYDDNFIFIMGIIIDKQVRVNNFLKLDIILSYGISDMKSGISLVDLTIEIPNNR